LTYSLINIFVSLILSELMIPYLKVVDLKIYRMMLWPSLLIGGFITGFVVFLIGYVAGNFYLAFFKHRKSSPSEEKTLISVYINKILYFSIIYEITRSLVILFILAFIMTQQNSSKYINIFTYEINYLYYVILVILLLYNLKIFSNMRNSTVS
jgi:hypothetical protein